MDDAVASDDVAQLLNDGVSEMRGREQSRLASLPIEQKPGPEPEPGSDERAESALPFDPHRRGRTEKAR